MIYISLTTVPLRMKTWDSLKINLSSLLNQKTERDYRIVLSVPYFYKNNDNEEYVVSEELVQFQAENPKLIVNRVEEDFGSIVKITGVLSVSKNPSDLIIVCDDDHEYSEDMLEYHVKMRKKHPKDIICFRGDSPVDKRFWTENGVKKYALKPTHVYFPVKHEINILIPGHWHSVGYKRSFFEEDFMSYVGSSDGDDIVAGYYFKKKQVNILCVPYEYETDFRPVNDLGRGSFSFPIVSSLPYPSSGFNEFRKKTGKSQGNMTKECEDYLYNNDMVFTESYESKSKVVVTLTTIPSRITQDYEEGIISNIKSLINQKYEGDWEIHFNVPKKLKYGEVEYEIPNWMRELSIENSRFKIFDNLEDLGPVTKLYYTIERIEDPETIIIVCDDDLVYDERMIEEQVKNQSKFSNCCVGYDGLRSRDDNGNFSNHFGDTRDYYYTSNYRDSKVDVLQHYKTVSYKRKYFEDDFFGFVKEYYSWSDDMLISAYMSYKKRDRIATFHESDAVFNNYQEWIERGGVATFPVIKSTSHEGLEGCNIYRHEKIDDNSNQLHKFIDKGYEK